MLEVVQHQEQAPSGNGRGEGRGDRLLTALAHTEGMRQRGGDQIWLGQRRQLDPGHPVGELVRHLRGNGQCKPRLADPTGTGQGQQAQLRLPQQGAGAGDFPSRPTRGVGGVGRAEGLLASGAGVASSG